MNAGPAAFLKPNLWDLCWWTGKRFILVAGNLEDGEPLSQSPSSDLWSSQQVLERIGRNLGGGNLPRGVWMFMCWRERKEGVRGGAVDIHTVSLLVPIQIFMASPWICPSVFFFFFFFFSVEFLSGTLRKGCSLGSHRNCNY